MGAGTETATRSAAEPAAGSSEEPERPPCSEQRVPCCSLYHHAVELIGKRWTGAILYVLLDGPVRFSELRELVPEVSDRLLSERLKELEGEGIVSRTVYDETPIRVEYGLTDKGQGLQPILAALKRWSHEHC